MKVRDVRQVGLSAQTLKSHLTTAHSTLGLGSPWLKLDHSYSYTHTHTHTHTYTHTHTHVYALMCAASHTLFRNELGLSILCNAVLYFMLDRTYTGGYMYQKTIPQSLESTLIWVLCDCKQMAQKYRASNGMLSYFLYLLSWSLFG